MLTGTSSAESITLSGIRQKSLSTYSRGRGANQPQIQPRPRPQPNRRYNKYGRPSLYLGNILDGITTVVAIRSGMAHEANPVMGVGLPRIIATKAVAVGLQDWVLGRMSRTHPKAATILGVVAGTVPALAATHNFKVIRENRK